MRKVESSADDTGGRLKGADVLACDNKVGVHPTFELLEATFEVGVPGPDEDLMEQYSKGYEKPKCPLRIQQAKVFQAGKGKMTLGFLSPSSLVKTGRKSIRKDEDHEINRTVKNMPIDGANSMLMGGLSLEFQAVKPQSGQDSFHLNTVLGEGKAFNIIQLVQDGSFFFWSQGRLKVYGKEGRGERGCPIDGSFLRKRW